MGNYKLTYKRITPNVLLIEWPSKIDNQILSDIVAYKQQIKILLSLNIQDIIPAYSSLTICFKHNITKTQYDLIKGAYKVFSEHSINTTIWNVPVCYDSSLGIDIIALAKSKNISVETFIHLHSSPLYNVHFIGFLPGFLYLGGLSNRLATPRKSTPRLKVSKGAVAIGGNQTGIYPEESPGGWHIIGNCPVTIFNRKDEVPIQVKAGDKLKFYPISIDDYRSNSKTIFKSECHD